MEDISHDIKNTASSITLRWEAQCKTGFEVKFREDTTKGFTRKQTQDQMIEIPDLKADTLYYFKVFSVDEEGDIHEIFNVKIKTEEYQLSYLRNTKNVDMRKKPYIYHLKPIDMINDQYVRTCFISKYGYSNNLDIC